MKNKEVIELLHVKTIRQVAKELKCATSKIQDVVKEAKSKGIEIPKSKGKKHEPTSSHYYFHNNKDTDNFILDAF